MISIAWDSRDMFNLMIYITFAFDPQYKIRAIQFWLGECKGDKLVYRIVSNVKFLLTRLLKQYNTFRAAKGENSNVAQEKPSTIYTNLANELPLPLPKFDTRLDRYLEEQNFMEFILE